MTPEAAEAGDRDTVALYRDAEGAEELRTCVCQAPPSDWLGGMQASEARL